MTTVERDAVEIVVGKIERETRRLCQLDGRLPRILETDAARKDGQLVEDRVGKLRRKGSRRILETDDERLRLIVQRIGGGQPCKPRLSPPDLMRPVEELHRPHAVRVTYGKRRNAEIDVPALGVLPRQDIERERPLVLIRPWLRRVRLVDYLQRAAVAESAEARSPVAVQEIPPADELEDIAHLLALQMEDTGCFIEIYHGHIPRKEKVNFFVAFFWMNGGRTGAPHESSPPTPLSPSDARRYV